MRLQLSGFADPVYSEALVKVRDYDIVLEILVINRTSTTLANLTVELSTLGDMKLVERPQSHTLGPLEQMTIRASIKVSSTETGHIFGTIVYDDASTREKCYINLNDIHMDIMDYIRPATCTDEAFRSMWAGMSSFRSRDIFGRPLTHQSSLFLSLSLFPRV